MPERDERTGAELVIDLGVGMAYVALTHNEVARTVQLSDLVMVDYDASGRAVGVEFMWPAPVSAGEPKEDA